MPRTNDRVPPSYDAIVRRTVVDPDSSTRPTQQQEREAHEGTRILSEDEQQLQAQVTAALRASPTLDLSRVGIEIDGSRIELRGRVRELAMIERIEQRLAAIEGVTEVRNRLVIDPDIGDA